MASTILRFEPNVPEIISLKFSEGKECESKISGDPQLYYTLSDGRSTYVSPEFGDRIRELGIRAGQPIEVVKRQRRGRPAEWEIRRVENMTTQQQQPAASLAPRGGAANSATEPARSGDRTQQQQQQTQNNAGAPMGPVALQLMSAIAAAIDACVESEFYAAGRGLTLTWQPEDVRALAITAFIQSQREAR